MPLNGRSAGMGSGAFRARLLDSRSVSARRRARLVVIEAGSLVLVYSVLPRFEGMLLSTEYSASAILPSLCTALRELLGPTPFFVVSCLMLRRDPW
jgi:hypothetical protein